MSPTEFGMKPGRELDALIAEKIFREPITSIIFEFEEMGGEQGYINTGIVESDVSHYSTDIAAAWEVVSKMELLGFEDFNLDSYGHNEWHCCFTDYVEKVGAADAPTAPLAICLAALKALGVSTDVEVAE